ncbi:hypothetical protein [Sporomusa carbonis]|uniref:hypothetical protein n=1 Tax=Sporomusa carbonis TaxID=3076075 RepID=UPI003C7B8FE8
MYHKTSWNITTLFSWPSPLPFFCRPAHPLPPTASRLGGAPLAAHPPWPGLDAVGYAGLSWRQKPLPRRPRPPCACGRALSTLAGGAGFTAGHGGG